MCGNPVLEFTCACGQDTDVNKDDGCTHGPCEGNMGVSGYNMLPRMRGGEDDMGQVGMVIVPVSEGNNKETNACKSQLTASYAYAGKVSACAHGVESCARRTKLVERGKSTCASGAGIDACGEATDVSGQNTRTCMGHADQHLLPGLTSEEVADYLGEPQQSPTLSPCTNPVNKEAQSVHAGVEQNDASTLDDPSDMQDEHCHLNTKGSVPFSSLGTVSQYLTLLQIELPSHLLAETLTLPFSTPKAKGRGKRGKAPRGRH